MLFSLDMCGASSNAAGWQVHEQWLYGLSFLHAGAPKTWYGLASGDAAALEAAMRREVVGVREHELKGMHTEEELMRAAAEVYTDPRWD